MFTLFSIFNRYTESGILIDLWESFGFNNDVVDDDDDDEDGIGKNVDNNNAADKINIIMADDDENMKKNPISCVSTNQTVKLTNRSDEQQQQQSIHSSNGEHILKVSFSFLFFCFMFHILNNRHSVTNCHSITTTTKTSELILNFFVQFQHPHQRKPYWTIYTEKKSTKTIDFSV